MNETGWIDLEDLRRAEAALPELLNDHASWNSLVSGSEDDIKIERLYRTFEEYDLFLIRVTRLTEDGEFRVAPDSATATSVVSRVLQGNVSVAVCGPKSEEDGTFLHLLAASLTSGSWFAYRTGSRESVRYDSPISLHVVVAKNPMLTDPNPASPELVAELLSEFRRYYMTEEARAAASERVFGY